MSRLATAGLALSLLFSCSATPLVATGESLKVVGTEFVATGELMNSAYNAKQLSTEQYSRWVTFGKKFQALYPLAVQIWEGARVVEDAAAQKHAAAIVAELATELAQFYDAVRTMHADGGL